MTQYGLVAITDTALAGLLGNADVQYRWTRYFMTQNPMCTGAYGADMYTCMVQISRLGTWDSNSPIGALAPNK
jgi:hypothetical protein